jgi:hypothetical protein
MARMSFGCILAPGAPMALAALEAVAEANSHPGVWPTPLRPARADPP